MSKRDVNHLISGLPVREDQRMLGLAETVQIENGASLCNADEPLRHAYFPLTSTISMIAGACPQSIAVAMIGNEGVLGASLAVSDSGSGLNGQVHSSGACLRLNAQELRHLLAESPVLLHRLHRYSHVLMGQVQQTAACNSSHEVEQRLARWLLMTDDRSNSNEFLLTHQSLADQLGVQRGAVTNAAGMLQRKRLIDCTRGQIRVLSRSGLESASCECYDYHIEDYARHFPG